MPEDARTRDELEIEWDVSDKTVLRRLKFLNRAGKLGTCEKIGIAIDGQKKIKPAYYYLVQND